MVQRYTIGWVPQSKQSLPKPEAGLFENVGAAVKSGLNERFVAPVSYTHLRAHET